MTNNLPTKQKEKIKGEENASQLSNIKIKFISTHLVKKKKSRINIIEIKRA